MNTELITQITEIIQAWNTADRRIREMLHGWEQRGARAGLERSAYIQIGQLDEMRPEISERNYEDCGRDLYREYNTGLVGILVSAANAQ